ncbi:cation:proton antiporter [Streptomyces durbertensis]|uniref:Cation:proton antiporter n=1 Tax=Streptomyces durbertensis TaxID=2448886 RepID=A0ABR6EKX9_9ACTN|nr:cation:proton antiporter [Streptomyces durbertensis]MBB1245975.1 cation:proton antiporter [Streptomyces durbertensis]
MLDVLLTVAGALALLVAAFSARIQRVPMSGPLLALLAGVLFGPEVLAVIDLPTIVERHDVMHEISRLLLAVSVMAVALRYPVRDIRPLVRPLTLLLVAGMIGMALITSALAAAILGIGLAAALLLGTALCATDPVLATSAVTGDPAERTIALRTRQLLSVESGANDGLALPLVLTAVALAGPLSGPAALVESLGGILGAVVFGAAVGAAGGWLLRRAEAHREVESGPLLIYTLLLALFVLGPSGLLHLDGILAVFVSGLAFNATSSAGERAAEYRIDEAVNNLLVLPLFTALGAMLPWREWAGLGWWRALLLVVAVLLLRRIPLLLALRRPLDLTWRDAVFLGWFGPMGVSALFYLTLEAARLEADTVVLAAGTLVVAASTIAHGITNTPALTAYRKAADRANERS